MPKLVTDAVRAMIESTMLCYVATVNADNTPNLSPKATLSVLDPIRVAFVDIASPGTVANLRRNPAVEVNVVDIFARRGYRLRGSGEVVDQGDDYDLVAESFWKKIGKAYPANHVVVVTVAEVLPVASPIYTFEPELTEDEIVARFRIAYGVGG